MLALLTQCNSLLLQMTIPTMIALYMLHGGTRPRPPSRHILLDSYNRLFVTAAGVSLFRALSSAIRIEVDRSWAQLVSDRPGRLRSSRPFSRRCIACKFGARAQTCFVRSCSLSGVRTLRTWPAVFRTKGRPRGCGAPSRRQCSGLYHHDHLAKFRGAWLDGVFDFVSGFGCPLMVVVMAKMMFEAGGSAG